MNKQKQLDFSIWVWINAENKLSDKRMFVAMLQLVRHVGSGNPGPLVCVWRG